MVKFLLEILDIIRISLEGMLKKILVILAFIAASISIVVFLTGKYNIESFINNDTSNEHSLISEKIKNVNIAINELSSLEEDLLSIEEKMIEMEIQSEVIKNEYMEAKELENITDEQINALKYAFNHKSLKDLFVTNLPGFFIGIATSLFASILYDTWKKYKKKHKKELNT